MPVTGKKSVMINRTDLFTTNNIIYLKLVN